MTTWFESLSANWAVWAVSASWQIALFVCLVAIAAIVGRRLPARYRYALWTLVILKALLPPGLGAPWSVGELAGQRWPESQAVLQPSMQLATTGESTAVDLIPPSQAEVGATVLQSTESAASESSATASPLQMAFMIWLVGLFVYTGFVAWRYMGLLRLIARAKEMEEGSLRVELERLALTLSRRTPPRLLVSSEIKSPFLCGVLRPSIILPTETTEELSPEELRYILLHELIHWRRHDVLAGWFQTIVVAVFWFHPLVWFAAAQFRHERECATDEELLETGQGEPRGYGESLLKVILSARGQANIGLGYLGIFERTRKLESRLEEIMSYERGRKHTRWLGWAFVGLFALLMLPMASVSSQAEQLTADTAEVVLSYDDGAMNDRQSYAGSGHAVHFTAPGNDYVLAEVAFHGSRYGTPDPPQENFDVYVLDANMKPLHQQPVPYSMVDRGDPRWYVVNMGNVKVPKEFYVYINYNAHQTKGVYMSYDTDNPSGNSFFGDFDTNFEKPETDLDWMIRARLLSQSSADSVKQGTVATAATPAPIAGQGSASMVSLSYDDNSSDGMQSYGDQGHAIKFAGAPGSELIGIELFGSRYGTSRPPNENFTVMVLDENMQLMHEEGFPYAFFKRGDPEWVPLKFSVPFKLPGDFWIYINFHAHQTKGVYLHYDTSKSEKYSMHGTPQRGFEPMDTNWMVRAHVMMKKPEPVSANTTPTGPPRIVDIFPVCGSSGVDPSIKELVLKFDQDMAGGFSWTGGGPEFPPITDGKKPYWKDSKTCALPVTLEPGKFYRVGINSSSHQNFRAKSGVPTPCRVLWFTTEGAAEDELAKMEMPNVVEFSPSNNDTNVDPKLTELRVTFDRPMGGGMSWTGGGPNFPETTGRSHWTDDGKTCVLPVKLKPNWEYHIGLNSFSHINFQSASGLPLNPVRYTFKTTP